MQDVNDATIIKLQSIIRMFLCKNSYKKVDYQILKSIEHENSQ